MSLGSIKIRALRKTKGIPIRKLATLARVNYVFLSRVERGLELPGEDLIFRLGRILGFEENPNKLVAMFGRVPSSIKTLIASHPELAVEIPIYFRSRQKKIRKTTLSGGRANG